MFLVLENEKRNENKKSPTVVIGDLKTIIVKKD